MSARASVSVVIAAWNTPASLNRCLDSLRPQLDEGIEIIVAHSFPFDPQGSDFANLKLLSFPSGTTVPQLRTAGITSATSEIVALSEDHCTFDRDWVKEMRKAHELHDAVAIGGAVENLAGQRPLDWAIYFLDYGRYMLPQSSGPAISLPGNNVSYKMAALDKFRKTFEHGFIETTLHGQMLKEGHLLQFAPAAIVYHAKHYRLGAALRAFFHHGRLFAGKRFARSDVGRRAAFSIASITLPMLLPARILRDTFGKKRYVTHALACLPYLFAVSFSWSCGELMGYIKGEGASARRWV